MSLMHHKPAPITTHLFALIVDTGERLPTQLAWTPAEPWVVTMTFTTAPNASISWAVSRDLLLRAQREHVAGSGDVNVLWWADVVYLNLANGEVQASVCFDPAALSRFVDETVRLVPPDAEKVDVDSWLRQIGVAS